MLKYLFSVLYIVLLLFFQAADARAQDNVILQLNWHHQFQFAGYYAAVEKGYYADLGLQVEISEGRPNLYPIDEIAAGRADYGIAGPEALIQYARGRPIKVMAAIFQKSPRVIAVNNAAGIYTPQDLAGKTVVLGNQVEMVAENYAMLLKEGVSLESLRVIQDFDWDGFLAGKIDAYSIYSTVQPYELNQHGITFSLLHPSHYGIDFYGDCLITSDSEIRDHPQRAKAFREASLKGWEYAMANPGEIINLIIEKYDTSVPKHERAQLFYEAQEMRELIKPELIKIGHINPGRWQHIAKTYNELGVIEGNTDIDNFIYSPEQLLSIWNHRYVKLGGVLLLLVSAGAIFLFYTNRRIRREIAQREKSREDLEKNQAILSEAEVLADMGSWEWDMIGDIWTVSDNWCNIHGCSKSQLTTAELLPFAHPGDRYHIERALAKAVEQGEQYHLEHRIIRQDNGEIRYVAATGKVGFDDAGKPVRMTGVAGDITKSRHVQTAIKQIEWMLSKKDVFPRSSEFSDVPYRDVVQFNRSRVILDAVGTELLSEVVDDVLDLLDTSAAVYEANGDYALDIFSSGWCRLLNEASRKLCNTEDGRAALASGKWLCHESCWTHASKKAIETGKAVDVPCHGGIRLYALPIIAGGRIVGSINMGYGNPPQNAREIEKIGKKYAIQVEVLLEHANRYLVRPPFIIELAKRRLQSAANLIGEIVERRRAEQERSVYLSRLQSLWGIAQMTEASHNELCNTVLEEIQELTSSRYSFFGFLDDDGKKMILHSWSTEALRQCDVEEKTIHFNIDEAGVWSQAVTRKEVFILNDFSQEHPGKKGVPPGHVPIENLMTVPILRDDSVVALAAVANKKSAYTAEDGEQVQAFVSNILLLLEKRQYQESLEKSDERLKLALEAVSDGVWDLRVDKDEVYFSPKWYSMLGYEPYELPQSYDTWRDLLHPEDRHEAEKTISHYLKEAKPFEVEFRMRTKDDQYRWILSRGKAVETNKEGEAVRMLGTHMDITERRKVEERVQQAQKLESIGSLAGGIAHDFNNLLFPIIGMSEMLLEDLPADSNESKFVQDIHHAGLRGSELVKQILAFSRQNEQEMTPVKIEDVVDEAVKLCRSSIPAQIIINKEIHVDCGKVAANATQLHQVVMNLVTNAYHAVSEKNGEIWVQLQQVSLHHDYLKNQLENRDYIKLTISDNGVGISRDAMARIFEPYYTTKKEGKGTGLGLAVVYGIIRDHHGDIKIYSEPGHGTTVQVFLPTVSQAAHEKPATVALVRSSTGNERILIVDDEHRIAHLESQILERLGYSVTQKTSSTDALELFREDPSVFDLVLTDFAMPSMTGIQLAAELKKIRDDIPVIISTGFSEQINEETAEKLGIQGYLMKPVVKNDLAEMVRRVLDGPTSK